MPKVVTRMYDDVFLPTDGSDAVRPVVEHALSLAEPFDATVHAVHVIENTDRMLPAGTLNVVSDAFHERGKEAVDWVAERAEERGLQTTTAVRRGEPVREISTYAEAANVDVVVMGTHGRSGVGRMVAGSVTERVMRRCSRPVLAVRRGDVACEHRPVAAEERAVEE
jgi:nucleotide-binding universal stress UspA family protein